MIINLTPHEIKINELVFVPSGIVARVSQKITPVKMFDGIPLVVTKFGETIDLPEYEDDTLLIVSAMVRIANPDRNDLASPGDLVRNENGQVVGCNNLIINNL